MQYEIFSKLLAAILGYQGGTVNLRRIMSPLFEESTKDEALAEFISEGMAHTEEERARVIHGVEAAGLSFPQVEFEDANEPEAPPPPPPETAPPPPPPETTPPPPPSNETQG